MNKRFSLFKILLLFFCSSAVFAEEADVEKAAIDEMGSVEETAVTAMATEAKETAKQAEESQAIIESIALS